MLACAPRRPGHRQSAALANAGQTWGPSGNLTDRFANCVELQFFAVRPRALLFLPTYVSICLTARGSRCSLAYHPEELGAGNVSRNDLGVRLMPIHTKSTLVTCLSLIKSWYQCSHVRLFCTLKADVTKSRIEPKHDSQNRLKSTSKDSSGQTPVLSSS